MKRRKARGRRRGRIEIIPMIDVMLFLLAAFMLASLTMQHINSLPIHLPHGTAAESQSRHPLTITVNAQGQLFLEGAPVSLDALADAIRSRLGSSDSSVTMAADSAAPHGLVVQAMLKARESGVDRFMIAVKHD